MWSYKKASQINDMVHIVVFILTQNMFNNLYICEYSCMSKTLCNSNEVLNKVCERIDDE